EIRLITPTDPEGRDDQGGQAGTDLQMSDAGYFQLTHDYLVPSLREWLNRHQKGTRTGRAELLLEDCANLWSLNKKARPLPTLEQWKEIIQCVPENTWTERQRRMMEDASKHHAISLWDRLLHAHTDTVLDMLEDLKPFHRFIDDTFREFGRSTTGED